MKRKQVQTHLVPYKLIMENDLYTLLNTLIVVTDIEVYTCKRYSIFGRYCDIIVQFSKLCPKCSVFVYKKVLLLLKDKYVQAVPKLYMEIGMSVGLVIC